MGKCPEVPGSSAIDGEPITGSITFKQLITYINYACFALTALLWLGLAIPHLRRYKAPDEQRPIFRIISTPLVFCTIALISLHAYNAAEYLDPLASLYEAYALASLFLLYVHYVVPEAHNRDEFFHNLESTTKDGRPVPGGSLRWFRRVWRTVFGFVVVYTILIIVQEVLQATGHACATTKKGKRGQIIVNVLQTISMVYALLAILRFQRRLKKFMEGRRAIMKLIAFKLFVALQILQRFIFSIVSTRVSGSSKITFGDISVGIPALLTSVESLIFTICFYFTFHSKEYRDGTTGPGKNYSGLRALLHALSPGDLIRGVLIAFTPWKPSAAGGHDHVSTTVHHHSTAKPV